MIRIYISEADVLDMIADRVYYWTDDSDIIDIYVDYYRDMIDNGCFDDSTVDVEVLVDNDYINYTQTISKEEFNNYNIEDEDDDRILIAHSDKDLYLIRTF